MKKVLLLIVITIGLINYTYAQPANDNPCSAQALTVSGSCVPVTYNNTNATGSGVTAPTCGNYGGADVWFSAIVAADGTLTITTGDTPGQMNDNAMAVYTGTCGALTQYACSDDAIGLFAEIVISDIALAGQTVYIRVWEYGGNQEGDFSICAHSCAGLGNDGCATAVDITSGGPFPGTTNCATPGADDPTPAAICAGSIENTVWWDFTPAVDGSYDISITGISCSSGTGIQIGILTGPCGGPYTSQACQAGSTVDFTTTFIGLAGTTYWVVVDGDAGSICDFTVEATILCQFSNNDCSTSEALTPNFGTDAQVCYNNICNDGADAGLTLTGPACGSVSGNVLWYEILTDAGDGLMNITASSSDFNPQITVWSDCATYSAYCNNPGTGNAAINAMPVTGLTTYYISVSPQSGVGAGEFDLCVTSYPNTCSPPDDCAGAGPDLFPALTSGVESCMAECNTGAVDPGGTWATDCGTVQGGITFYQFTSVDLFNDISVTSADISDPMITVFSDCNTAFTNLCASGSSGSATIQSYSQPTGSTILFAVTSASGTQQGDFTVCVNSYPDMGLCNTSDTLIVTGAVPAADGNGNYLPGTTVSFCYEIDTFIMAGFQYLHAVMPTFGSAWDISTIAPLNTVAVGGAGVADANVDAPTGDTNANLECTDSRWVFYPAGTVIYNNVFATYGVTGKYPDGTPLPYDHWAFLSCETSSGNSDPNASYGDGCTWPGGPPGCYANTVDGFGYSWTFCFEITTKATYDCVSPEDFSIQFETFGDGETGNYLEIGCIYDIPDITIMSAPTPAPIVVSLNSVTNVTCNGDTDGEIDVSATGGYGTLQYQIDGGAGYGALQATGVFQNLAPGSYNIQVVDDIGCSNSSGGGTFTVVVGEPAIPNGPTASYNGPLCEGEDLILNSASGYDGGTYMWNGPNGFNDSNEDPALIPNATIANNAGIYNVSATLAGCPSGVSSITVTINANPTGSYTSTMPTCNGDGDATSTASGAGGKAPYSYLWNNGQATATATGLTQGSFTVTITDGNGCVAVVNASVTDPLVLNNSIVGTNVLCNGNSTGSANQSVTGGVPGYTYLWSSGPTTQDISGLGAGNYDVTVTDSQGCTDIAAVVITEPAAALAISLVNSSVTCNGGSNGTVTSTVTGGTTNYTYAWSSGPTTANLASLTQGTYTVTVTDANGCSSIAASLVVQPTALAISSTITNASCGSSNGNIATVVSGGEPAYTYAWSNGQSGATSTALGAGSYSVTVTDANTCTLVRTYVVANPNPTVSISGSSNVSCNGGSDGTATATVVGGIPAYTYLWSNGNTNAAATGFSVGAVSVTLTDGNTCNSIASITLTEPTVLATTIVPTDALCNGASNGSINLTVSGGTPVITYLWGGGQTTQDIASQPAGGYSVTVTDGNSCSTIAMTTISEPAALAVTVTTSDVSCNGGADGTVTSVVTGGSTAYGFVWSSGPTTQNLINVLANTYSVTVTDAQGCSIIDNGTVAQPIALASNVVCTNTTVVSGTDGSASSTTSNGTPVYTYLWSNGQTTANASTLSAGTVSLTVTDAAGCSVTDNCNVNDPGCTVSASTTLTNVSCNSGANGTATGSMTGSAGSTYTYQWGNGQTTATAVGLSAGTYNVTITDNIGCVASSSAIITQPPVLALTVNCANTSIILGTDGSATSGASGGITGYTYLWSQGTTTMNVAGLSSGVITLTLTDAAGCTITDNCMVNDPGCAVAVSTTVTDASCNGGADGTATAWLTGSGGSAYTYIWADGQTTATATGLSSVAYNVTVSDNVGCSSISSATPGEPSALALTVNCAGTSMVGGTDGSASASPLGGTPAYTYAWSNGETTVGASGLSAGNISLVLTDALGCTVTDNCNVVDPACAVTAVTTLTIPSCNGGANGTATASMSGSISTTYIYIWDNSQSTATAAGLVAATYNVTVTDGFGCSATASAIVGQPALLTLSVACAPTSVVAGTDGSATSTPGGGTVPYTYVWSNSQTIANATNLSAGNISLVVTDGMGCTVTDNCMVNDPGCAVSGSTTSTDISCNGLTDGTSTATMSGSSSTVFTYVWANGQTTATATGVGTSAVAVTITDGLGCVATTTGSSTEPNVLTATVSCVSASTVGGSDGSASSSVGGGSTGYTYSWSNTQTSANASVLSAGGISLVVTDAAGCTVTDNCTVVEPACTVTAATTVTDVSCNAGTDGSATVTMSGSNSTIFTYNWSDGQTTGTAIGLTATNFDVTITDSYGCSAISAATPAEPTALTLSIVCSDATTVGGSEGGSVSTIGGGTTAYTYAWSDGQTTANAIGLSQGSITLVATDAAGCTVTDNCIVNDPGCSVVASANMNPVSCNGGSDGSAIALLAGGGTTFTYFWASGSTVQTAGNLSIGTYDVTITDNFGCSDFTSVTVTQPTVFTTGVTSVDATCFGGSDGSADLTVSGATSPYTYLWDNGSTLQDPANFLMGTQGVTITDFKLCTTIVTVTVGQATQINGTTSATLASCGGSDGTASVSATGGTSGYTYLWDNGQTSTTATGFSAGVHAVTITDAVGCTVTDNGLVSNSSTPNVTITGVAGVTCNGDSDGTATASATGGATPYNFTWSSGEGMVGTISSSTATALSPGNALITVEDNLGCLVFESISITEPNAVGGTIVRVNTSCATSADGEAALTATGGNSAYTYLWNNTETTATVTGLIGGAYFVTITDGNGCTGIESVTITNPGGLVATVVLTEVKCNGDANGGVNLAITGGTPPYSFIWSNGSTIENQLALAAGPYSATVTDDSGCTIQYATTMTEPTALSVTVNCFNTSSQGASDGGAVSVVSGGTSPYIYFWGNGQNTPNASGLATGMISIVVADLRGCIGFANCSVTDPPCFGVLATTITNVNCAGGSDGTVIADLPGGTTPYSYLWDNGETTGTITGLSGGALVVTITDGYGCEEVGGVNISSPLVALVANGSQDQGVSCNGLSDGQASVVATNGTSGYSYEWSNGGATSVISGLAAATYDYTVTDANGCQEMSSVVISQPNSLTTSLVGTDVGCDAASNGTATLSISGGTTGYTYLWSNAQVSQSLTGLGSGNFIVTVTDANGCSAIDNVIIVGAQPMLVNMNIGNSSCGLPNGSASGSASGGQGPYTYNWAGVIGTTNSVTGLSAGDYQMSVTDALGCQTVGIVGIMDAGSPVLSVLNQSNVGCNGAATGSILVNTSGGTGPYNYNWSDGQSQANAIQLIAGSYNVTASDANGCEVTTNVVIIEPEAMLIDISSTVANCGLDDGTATIIATGGDSPYTYIWDASAGSQSGATASNLPSGTYTVQVADVNGCVQSVSSSVGLNTTIDASFTVELEEDGDELVPITANFTNTSVGAYVFDWQFGNGDSSDEENPTYVFTEQGPWTVTLYAMSDDSALCIDSASYVVAADSASNIIVPIVFSPNNDGINDVFNVEINNIVELTGTIFNRWGEKIYAWNTVQGGWDGSTISGTQAPDGVYFFMIDVVGGDGKVWDTIQGAVTLVR